MNYFWCFWCFFFTVSSLAQTKIKGQVIDFDNAVPIAFASITYNKSTINADWEGKFSLTIEDLKSPVKINYKGYAIYKKINNPYFDKLVKDIRAKFKASLITTKVTLPTIEEN